MNLLMITLIMLAGPMNIPVKKLIVSPTLQEKLELKGNQLNEIKNIWFESREKLIPLNARRQKLLLDIEKELSKDDVNLENLKKLYDELGDVISRIRYIKTKTMVSVKQVLTRKQLIKLEEERLRWKRYPPPLPYHK